MQNVTRRNARILPSLNTPLCFGVARSFWSTSTGRTNESLSPSSSRRPRRSSSSCSSMMRVTLSRASMLPWSALSKSTLTIAVPPDETFASKSSGIATPTEAPRGRFSPPNSVTRMPSLASSASRSPGACCAAGDADKRPSRLRLLGLNRRRLDEADDEERIEKQRKHDRHEQRAAVAEDVPDLLGRDGPDLMPARHRAPPRGRRMRPRSCRALRGL